MAQHHAKDLAGQTARAPKIVTRVNSIPVVNRALSLGFLQYDKLKSSNATVGDVMNRAEGLVVYFWQKVQPIVDKLQDPISKADELACSTLDFVENMLSSKIPQSVDTLVARYKPSAILAQANSHIKKRSNKKEAAENAQ